MIQHPGRLTQSRFQFLQLTPSLTHRPSLGRAAWEPEERRSNASLWLAPLCSWEWAASFSWVWDLCIVYYSYSVENFAWPGFGVSPGDLLAVKCCIEGGSETFVCSESFSDDTSWSHYIFARKICLRSKNLISCGKLIMLIYLIVFIPVNLIKMSLVNTVWNSIAIVYL